MELNENQKSWMGFMERGSGLEADEFTGTELEEMHELIEAGLVERKRVYGNTYAFVKAPAEVVPPKERLEDIKQKSSFQGGEEYYGDAPYNVRSDLGWLITELEQQRFQNEGQKRNFDLVKGQISRYEEREGLLVAALDKLIERCEIADAEGELSERIDGELLDECRKLLV